MESVEHGELTTGRPKRRKLPQFQQETMVARTREVMEMEINDCNLEIIWR